MFLSAGIRNLTRICHTQLLRNTVIKEVRNVSHSSKCCNQSEKNEEDLVEEDPSQNAEKNSHVRDPKDRSRKIPVEISMKYMESDAYKTTYGDDPVWKLYKRNFKGNKAPRETRRTCIRNERICCGSPCPICRDEYLIPDFRNIKLIKQFISEHNGEILDTSLTNVCRKQNWQLVVAINKARDCGLLTFDPPFVCYDYSDCYREVMEHSTFVIVGGGISGVICAQSLGVHTPESTVALITASPTVKSTTNLQFYSKNLFQFDVEEREASFLSEFPNLKIIQNVVKEVKTDSKTVVLESGQIIGYEKLCLCTGARPKLIVKDKPRVIGIRDTESVSNLVQKLQGARKVVIVGNGGIATELVHEIEGVEIVWVIKDSHISATFVDPGAAEFFQLCLAKEINKEKIEPVKRMRYTVQGDSSSGPALGPDWHQFVKLQSQNALPKNLQVEYQCEVLEVVENSTDEDWPVVIKISNGKTIGCDLVVSATGVSPNSDLKGLENLKKGEDGGFLVDWKMETSQNDIYAVGDVCSAGWELARHWFQMRLWTQAYQMGMYVAKSMMSSLKGEQFYQDFCFELFTHCTKFFGFKVVLLGLYNGQKLEGKYEVLLRVTKDEEYVKLVMVNGRLQGAVLIGETDLEEMCENLILNQLDLSVYGEDLLNPDIDIEDYFD